MSFSVEIIDWDYDRINKVRNCAFRGLLRSLGFNMLEEIGGGVERKFPQVKSPSSSQVSLSGIAFEVVYRDTSPPIQGDFSEDTSYKATYPTMFLFDSTKLVLMPKQRNRFYKAQDGVLNYLENEGLKIDSFNRPNRAIFVPDVFAKSVVVYNDIPLLRPG